MVVVGVGADLLEGLPIAAVGHIANVLAGRGLRRRSKYQR
jgi:hypothetical protein